MRIDSETDRSYSSGSDFLDSHSDPVSLPKQDLIQPSEITPVSAQSLNTNLNQVRAPTDCWAGGWTPEICCSSPGAQGNPLCWDHIFSYEKCCTDTLEGKQFHAKRVEFVQEMIKKGAMVKFEIKQIEGTGRSGAVSNIASRGEEDVGRKLISESGENSENESDSQSDSESVTQQGNQGIDYQDDIDSKEQQKNLPLFNLEGEQTLMRSNEDVLRIPGKYTYTLLNLPSAIKENAASCDEHAQLSLGLLNEERKGRNSFLASWIELLPRNFANLPWFNNDQRTLVKQTYFKYIYEDWEHQLKCMDNAYKKIWPQDDADDRKVRKARGYHLRWAFSIVKTRGFAFNTYRNSTALIPLADFLNHHPNANVRTPDPESGSRYFTSVPDVVRFKSTADIQRGDELCIEYTQASNLEFMIRYGFRVDKNPFGGRHFDLEGEKLQAYCPPIILRYDISEVVQNATVDCHRQARYLSWQQKAREKKANSQDSTTNSDSTVMSREDRLQQDSEVYQAIQSACTDMQKSLDVPPDKPKLVHYERYSNDPITRSLVNEIRQEKRLLQKCQDEFYRRRIDRDKALEVNSDIMNIASSIASKIVNKYVGKTSDSGIGGGGRGGGKSESKEEFQSEL